jgi:hypothetical protein
VNVLGGHPEESISRQHVVTRQYADGTGEGVDAHLDIAAFREVFCADVPADRRRSGWRP